MRTFQLLTAAGLLLAAFFLLARLFAAHYPGANRAAFIAFALVWFAVAALNMWLGVARAGYSVAEELPIFVLVFGVPMGVAVAMKWSL